MEDRDQHKQAEKNNWEETEAMRQEEIKIPPPQNHQYPET